MNANKIDSTLYRGPKAEPYPGGDSMPGGWIVLMAKDIQSDGGLNPRKNREEKEPNADPVDLPSELALRATIVGSSLAPAGVMSPIRVRRQANGGYSLVFGSRRAAAMVAEHGPDSLLFCTVQPQAANEKEARKWTISEGLRENLARRKLSSWETVQSLFDLQQEDPGLTAKVIAKGLGGISDRHVSNCIRLRRQLHPELWEKFKLPANEGRFLEFLSIAGIKPVSKQLAAFEAGVIGKRPKKDKEAAASSAPKLIKAKEFQAIVRNVKKDGVIDVGGKHHKPDSPFATGFLLCAGIALDKWELLEVEGEEAAE